MPDHKDLTAASGHVIGYVQTTDPGAIGAGKAWIDTSSGSYVLKIRNATNAGWETSSPEYVILDGGIVQYDEDIVTP